MACNKEPASPGDSDDRAAPDVGDNVYDEDTGGHKDPADTADSAPPHDSAVVHDSVPSDTAPVETARPPGEDELVITEIMINPHAVSDENGEWVEILNLSDETLDLTGLALGDADQDLCLIESIDGRAVTLAPGALLVVCANPNLGDNGGVECGAAFYYNSIGEGCALANSGDEVYLLGTTEKLLDGFEYGDKFAPQGSSIGVDPDYATPKGNDKTQRWCPQTGPLKSGDTGTPGRPNQEC